MSRFLHLTRDHAVERTRRRLQREGFPRLQMALLPEAGLPDLELPSVGDAAGAAADADELAIPLLALLLALGLALASLWVVWTAPALLSEVLVDGALSFTLYRHLRRTQPRHWLSTAVRRTVVPFLLTAVFLAVAGGALSAAAPGARSIGEVVRGTGAPR